MIEPSWEVFDECPKCFAEKKKPCYNLTSTSANLVVNSNPHPARKKLKCTCVGINHANHCPEWVLPL